MTEAERKAKKRAYDAKRYAERTAEFKERNLTWYRANRESQIARQSAWNAANANKMAPYYAQYRRENREQIKAKNDRRREADPTYEARYYAENRERRLAMAAAWVADNPERARAHWARRRAAKRQRVPGWFGEFDNFVIQEAYDIAAKRQHLGDWHVDHMVPLRARAASGLHCANNIQVIPAILNQRKHHRMWLTERLEWLQHV